MAHRLREGMWQHFNNTVRDKTPLLGWLVAIEMEKEGTRGGVGGDTLKEEEIKLGK